MPVSRMTPLRSFMLFLCAFLVSACASWSDVPTASSSDEAFAIAASLGRGINFGNMLEAPREGDWSRWARDRDIDRVAEAGFATIRLPVRFSNHAETRPPYRLDPDFLAHIDHIIDRALADRLNIIVDFQAYRQIYGEPLDPQESEVEPDQVQERFVALWAQLAEHFRDRPKQVLFELLNEPHGALTPERWNVLLRRTLEAVRARDTQRMVLIGPADANIAQDLVRLELPDDPALIVTIHDYQPFDFTHQGANWVEHPLPVGVRCCDQGQIERLLFQLDIAADWGRQFHRPIYLGEFGSIDQADMDSRAFFTRAMRDAAERRGMSWAYWEYDAGFGVYDLKAHQWRQPLRDALLGP